MKRIFICHWALIAALLLASACSKNETPAPDPEPEPQPEETLPVTINQNAFRFGSKAVETFSLSIGNTTAWDVRNDAPWVIAEKQPDNTLRITATPSRMPVDRSATLTVAATNPEQGEASFTVTQAHGTPVLYIRPLLGSIGVRHCSENGRWVAGQKAEQTIIVDVNSLADDTYAGMLTSLPGGVHSIDNNGTPHSGGCSGDGSIYSDYDTQSAVDNGPNAEFFPARYIPYIMRNNRKIELAYPATYPTSNIAVEGYVTRHMYQGCIPDKVSADGKYIYGRLMNVNNGWFAARWTRIGATNDYTFKELGLNGDGDLNVWDTLYTQFEGNTYMTIEPKSFLCAQNVSGLSMYGKYACGHYGASMSGGGQLFRYDMEADRLDLLDATGVALYITDDGTLFTSDNKVYKLGSNTYGSLGDWITETYGSDIAGQIPSELRMGSVSADNTTTVLFPDPMALSPISYIITIEP
jgi:hypothetical protein